MKKNPELTERQKAVRDYILLAVEKAGITKTELARRLKKRASTINRPASNKPGKSSPKLELLLSIRKETGVEFTPELSTIYDIDSKIEENKDIYVDLGPSNIRMATEAPEILPHIYQRDVRVLGTAECGDDGAFEINMGETVGWAPRLPGIIGATGVYAIWCEGASMMHAPERSYAPGRLVYVHSKKPIRVGFEVVIQIKPDREGETPRAYLKTLISKGMGYYKVKQWNPEKEIKIPESKVLSIHYVLTFEELINA